MSDPFGLPDPPPAEELQRRREAVQAALRAGGVDGALLVNGADLVYLAGTAQSGHLVLPAEGEAELWVRRDLSRARAESALERVEPLTSLRHIPAILEEAGLAGRVRLGLELDELPARDYMRLAGQLPEAELVDAMPAVWAARRRKTPWELERIRLACAQSAAAQAAAPRLLAPGRREVDVLTELGSVMRELDHEGTIRFRGRYPEFFFGHVLGGPSAAVPGPTETPLAGPGLSSAQGRGPSRRLLAEGDAVVVDICGYAQGYLSDQTRTFALGRIDRRLEQAYAACRSILAELVPLLRPGTPGTALYDRGLELATEAGFGEHFMGHGPTRVRFVGHCIGLELNEPPYLAHGFEGTLEPGNVVAVEPKLVFPGVGAVGLENTYLVGEDGAEPLTWADEELVDATA